jgi:TonB family protein
MIAKRYMQAFAMLFALVCLAGAQELQRVTEEEALQHIKKRVAPTYPQMAQIAHIQGVVVLEITITDQGSVANPKPVSGHPILIPAAVDAVKQWEFEPFLVNGSAVPVRSPIKVAFGLGAGAELRGSYLNKETECSQLLLKDKFTAAEIPCRKALDVADKLPEGFEADKMRAYGNAGTIAFRLGKLQESVEYFQKQLAFAGQLTPRPIVGQAHASLAHAYEATGSMPDADTEYTAAEKALESAMTELEGRRGELKPAAFNGVKASYSHNLSILLEDHAKLLRKMGKAAEAQALEQKAALLAESK